MEQKFITTVQDTGSMIWSYVPSLVGALAILVVGWFVAGWLARIVRVGFEKSGLAGRVSKAVSGVDAEDAKMPNGNLLAMLARVAILILASAMGLGEM